MEMEELPSDNKMGAMLGSPPLQVWGSPSLPLQGPCPCNAALFASAV